MDTLVQQARAFAAEMHEGQIDRDGRPHIDHCERVAAVFTDNPTLEAAALLHDVLEDTPCTYLELTLRFPEEVAQIVRLLTRGEEQSFRDYLWQIAGKLQYPRFDAAVHRMACLLKIADIEDNMRRADAKFTPKLPMYRKGLIFLHQDHE